MEAEVGETCFGKEDRVHEAKNVGGLQKLESQEKQILPWSLQKDHHPAETLQDLFRTYHPQKYKMINLSCFKPLSLWQFVRAARGNQCSALLVSRPTTQGKAKRCLKLGQWRRWLKADDN